MNALLPNNTFKAEITQIVANPEYGYANMYRFTYCLNGKLEQVVLRRGLDEPLKVLVDRAAAEISKHMLLELRVGEAA